MRFVIGSKPKAKVSRCSPTWLKGKIHSCIVIMKMNSQILQHKAVNFRFEVLQNTKQRQNHHLYSPGRYICCTFQWKMWSLTLNSLHWIRTASTLKGHWLTRDICKGGEEGQWRQQSYSLFWKWGWAPSTTEQANLFPMCNFTGVEVTSSMEQWVMT